MSGKLTDGFRELLDLRWSEFVAKEADPDQDNFTSIVVSLVRAAQKGNLRAIREALDRLDGKIATEIEVEYPKFIYRYPFATSVAKGSVTSKELPVGELPAPAVTTADAATELPTGSLRAVLERMLAARKDTVARILGSAATVDAGDKSKGDPYVKSVMVAGLLDLVHKGKLSAIFEVFEQIDGKVADKIKLLGDDVYIDNYSEVAPAGAIKGEDGVYILESPDVTNSWALRLEQENRNGRR